MQLSLMMLLRAAHHNEDSLHKLPNLLLIYPGKEISPASLRLFDVGRGDSLRLLCEGICQHNEISITEEIQNPDLTTR